jgi:CubicO group peptidase (beta-lactamase class C family)
MAAALETLAAPAAADRMTAGMVITAAVHGGAVTADTDAPVPWWSFAKTVLAAAALMLVAAGRLQLDEPVRGRTFTLRQLLQHRAGLRCYGGLQAYHAAVAAAERAWPIEEMLRRVDADTLAYAPGQGWGYSNLGYLLVRRFIEDEAGMPLGPALERLVFGPLGIDGVTVADSLSDLDATAWGNERGYDPRWVYHGLLIGPAGAAAMVLHRLLAGELLPADLLLAMLDAVPVGGVVPGRPWQTAQYGLGLMVGEGVPPGVYVGHSGGGPGSTSAVYRLAMNRAEGRSLPVGAAFAPLEEPGTVEGRAMALAGGQAGPGMVG